MSQYGTKFRTSGFDAEAYVAFRVLSLGYEVFKPWSGSTRYDLIADNGKGLWRLQVKKIHHNVEKGANLDLRKPNTSGKRTSAERRYGKGDCDYIVAVELDKNNCYVIPVEEVAQKCQVRVSSSEWLTQWREAWF